MLENVSIFSGLDSESLQQVERYTVAKTHRKHAVLIEAGDEANMLYVIIKGRVKVFLTGDDGKELVLSELASGDYFGELGLLSGDRRTASIMTLENCDFLILTKASLLKLIADQPSVAVAIMQDLVKKLRSATDSMGMLGLMDVYGRIRKVITDAAQEEDGRLLTGRMTQQDIADRVGSSREMVSKILSELRKGGYVETSGKRIQIKKHLPTRW